MIAPSTLAEDIVDALFARYPKADVARRAELISVIVPVIEMAMAVDAEYND